MQPIVVNPADPHCALNWRKGTAVASGCMYAAWFLVLLGLILKTVMYVDLQLLSIEIDVDISYYNVKVTSGSNDFTANNDYSLDQATCDKGGLVRFAGAINYFVFAAAIVTSSFLSHELKTVKYKSHIVLAGFIVTGGLMSLNNGLLAIVRGHANSNTCDTVLAGLERYGMGSCWICLDCAFTCTLVAGACYICSRYMKCCCYTQPVVLGAGYQQQAPLVGGQQAVVGQPVYQQQPQQQYQQAPQQGYQQQPQQQYQQAPPQQQQQQQYYQQQPPQEQYQSQPGTEQSYGTTAPPAKTV